MGRIRVMIISDTHGEDIDHSHLPPVDVAIHCGDLTEESKIDEFESALRLMRTIKAEIKLVIAGNHDFTLDEPTFRKKIADAQPPLDSALVRRTYGDYGDAERLLSEEPGVKFLREGTHAVDLPNGKVLKVYASPCTASKSDWGFAYDPDADHEWRIPTDTDIAITHSPPLGVLDMTDSRIRAGSQSLFAAVAAARPKVHCFGHIHEGWGAKLVQWRDIHEDVVPTHFTAIDNDCSSVIETLGTLKAGKFDSPEILQEKELRRRAYDAQGYCDAADRVPVAGLQTLFINAAIESESEDKPPHLPWIVEVDLRETR